MSGTALAADVSATRRHRSLAMTIFFGIASLLFSSGCEVSNATSLVGKTEAGPAHTEIDAGVIFGDRSSYLCIPLSRFGIASSGEIEALDSSCECVKPMLVHYSDTAATVADGLLLEFVAEDHASDSTPQPMHLAVDVKWTLFSGKSRTVTVNFLHAPLLTQGEL